jgi:hypothetical protein
MLKMRRIFSIAILACTITGCEQIALMTTPKKQACSSYTILAEHAEATFWTTLRKGKYNEIPHATKLLTAAYLESPNDPNLAAHLGFLHIWKITERQRLKTNEPTIVDEIILAKKYFSDATALNPSDARFQGFLADSTLIEGKIFADQYEQTQGYFELQHAITMWPEFNYFTGGYIMSNYPTESSEFKQALDWQWKTLDLCAGTKVDRNNPDFSPYLSRETQEGPQRACWNSWIAPHNYEGFFLNMGDMLAKNGQLRQAKIIYANAKLTKNYASWPYRKMLEERITKLESHEIASKMMFDSGRGCVVCHQAK